MKKALVLGAMALPIAAAGSISQPSAAVAQTAGTWTGAYVTGSVGGAWGSSSQHDNGFGTTIFIIGDGHYNISGPLAGGGFGYNWQNGQWVAGLETDLSWADIKGHGICEAALAAGKHFSQPAANMEHAEELIAMGTRLIFHDADVLMLNRCLRANLDQIAALRKNLGYK